MTKDQLNQKHFDKYYARSTSAATHEHAQVSIEYAISVLEEIRDNASANQFYYEDAVKEKIKKLQLLIE